MYTQAIHNKCLIMHDIGGGNAKIIIKRNRNLTKEILTTPKVGTNVRTARLNIEFVHSLFLCV